ncbi:MAG: hypothetical protein ACK5L7_04215 [Paludibacteraceae bacterium]
MKKFNLFFISLLALIVTFSSCKKDDDPTGNNSKVSGTIQDGSSLNSPSDSVYVYLEDDGSDVPFAKSALNSGSFNINLETPSSSQLYSLSDGLGSSITASDKSANGVVANFTLSSSGEVASLYYGKYSFSSTSENISATVATYIYCDRSLTLKGTETDEDGKIVFDVKFGKGWNILLTKVDITSSTMTITYTSKSSTSGLGLIWTTIDLGVDIDAALQNKMIPSKLFK